MQRRQNPGWNAMLLFRRLITKPSVLSPFGSSYRFLSIPPQKDGYASPTSNFAVQYLINTCGLPSDKAARGSRYLPHFKSSEQPDAVLRFLRQSGVTEAHIKAAALRHASFLCYSIENCFKPRLAELQELGFSPSDISLLLSIVPVAFRSTKLQQNVQFWLPFFGSVEKLLRALKTSFLFLTTNLENSVMPNLAYLREQCGLPADRISQLVYLYPITITPKPEVFKMNVRRAQELGVPCSSRMFVYALSVVTKVKKSTVDARLRFFESLGFSREEVTILITKCPSLLMSTEKLIGQKMEFLLQEVGCAKIDMLINPTMLCYSLEKRLVPRSHVRKLLKSKGIRAANNGFMYFAQLNEKQFLERFVLPYEGKVPGLRQAYTDAYARKTTAVE